MKLTNLAMEDDVYGVRHMNELHKRIVKRGEIYLLDIGDGKGSEQKGVKYGIVIQNNVGNIHSPNTIVAIITSQHKTLMPTHVDFMFKKESTILAEQIRTVSKERLIRKVGEVSEDTMRELDRALMISLGLCPEFNSNLREG